MFRLRRAWLLFPLLGLTLFFAACGWRNWNLQSDRHGVRISSAIYAVSQLSRGQIWASHTSAQDARVIEQEVKRLKPDTNIHLFSFQPPSDNSKDYSYFYVEEIEVQNRFHATAYVGFADSHKQASQIGEMRRALVFTRSPITFWDNSWHLKQASKGEP